MPWKKGSSYIITPLGAKNIAGPWLSLVIIIWKKRKGALELPHFLRPGCQQCKLRDPAINKFMGKRFQAAQLTHERFLILYHSSEIFFWYLLKCKNLTFKVNFLCQKSSESFQFFFIEEYEIRSTSFISDTFCLM